MGLIPEPVWQNLLTQILARQVIPIVGPDAVRVSANGQSTTLQDHLAEYLSQNFGVAYAPGEPDALNAVASRIVAQQQRRDEIDQALSFYLDSTAFEVPETLRRLARIRHFSFFVSTTCDGLLARAIDAERFDGLERTEVLSYSPSTRCDLPRPIDAIQAQLPIVMHLFGRVSASPEYALTERDAVDYVHDLQQFGATPRELFGAFSSRHVLLIGTGLPEWLARFFVRVVRARSLDEPRSKTQFVADPALTRDASLKMFFDRLTSNAKLLPVEDTAKFVEELEQRYQQRVAATPGAGGASGSAAGGAGNSAARKGMRAGSVFISYTRDDLAAARKLRDTLDAAHIDVWLDENELQGGSAWEHEIVQNISNCSLFVPLLSHATASEHRRESFFRHEWNQAAYRVRGMAESMAFILPVVIDDSSVEASHPPEIFLKRQWTSAPGGKPGAEFVQRIVGLYKDYQVMKKGGGV